MFPAVVLAKALKLAFQSLTQQRPESDKYEPVEILLRQYPRLCDGYAEEVQPGASFLIRFGEHLIFKVQVFDICWYERE